MKHGVKLDHNWNLYGFSSEKNRFDVLIKIYSL